MDVYNLVIIVVTAITSAGAWKFYETYVRLKRESKKESYQEGTMFREDLRQRVIALEVKLEMKDKEKDELYNELVRLKTQIAELRVKLEFLEKENKELRESHRNGE